MTLKTTLNQSSERPTDALDPVTLLRQLFGNSYRDNIDNHTHSILARKLSRITYLRSDPRAVVVDALKLWNALSSLNSEEQLRQSLEPKLEHYTRFWDYCTTACVTDNCERPSLIRTECGMFGFASCAFSKGDLIIVIRNDWPFVVVRPAEDNCYAFQGFAYIHGMMTAQFWDDWNGESYEEEAFTLS